MTSRFQFVAVALLVALPVGAADVPPDAARLEAVVREVLAEVPLIDGHNDAPWQIRDRFADHLERVDFTDTSRLDPPMATDIKRLRAGLVGGQVWSVWVPPGETHGESVVAVLEQVDLVKRLVRRYPADLELALTADDVLRIHRQGRIASLIGIEGGYAIGGSLAVLRDLYALGARYMTLTHWLTIEWADAATDAPKHGGLSPFGEAVVKEMNRLGMLVDLAHVSPATVRAAVAVSRAPVIVSHGCAAALNPHPRNVPDDILRLIADHDGVVMVAFGSFFVSARFDDWAATQEAEQARLKALHPGDEARQKQDLEAWKAQHPKPEVALGELADHVDHVRKVAGIDHVGLGSDFDGIISAPKGVEDVSGYPRLLVELLRRGWSREDLAKVAGLNFLRVLRRAEEVAASLQAGEAPCDLRLEEAGVAPAPAAPPSH